MRLRFLSAAFAVLLAAPPVLAQGTPARSGPYTLELLNESGTPLPSWLHNGTSYTLGATGQRYTVRVHNHSGRRIEVVGAVDGRDVRDGEPSRMDKRGYIVEAYGEAIIDGFRLSQDSVAAFRFSSVSKSYASQMGDARDVGVVGVAIFTERTLPPLPTSPQDLDRNADGYNPPSPAGARASSGRMMEKSAAPSQAESQALARPEGRRAGPDVSKDRERAGLGTAFGEQHDSHIDFTEFERSSPSPATVLALHYNDRSGLRALGVPVDPPRSVRDDRWERAHAEPFRRDPGYAQPPAGWCAE